MSVAIPNLTRPRYTLGSGIRYGISLVASSRHRGNSPVAMGSRVPRWPIFRIPKARRARRTTSKDVTPSGLSMSRMPEVIGYC